MPKPVKNFILMFLGAMLIFMVLVYIDEYENLVAPFVKRFIR